MNKYEETLTKSWDGYDALTDAVAELAFAEVIKPFCVKRGLRFLAGNGTYFIGGSKGQSINPWDVEDDEEFQAIFKVLDTEIPGMIANSLGCIMPDYDPPKGEK